MVLKFCLSFSHRLSNIDKEGQLYGVQGSSGEYAETIFRHAVKVIFGKEIMGPLEFKTLRNADFREVTLQVSLMSFFTSLVLAISRFLL